MPTNPVDRYAAYKEIQALPQDPRLAPFERFLLQTDASNTIEFSQKFSSESEPGSGYDVNPLRFTLWKYKFDLQRDQNFLLNGVACFREMAAGTAAAEEVARFAELPFARTDAELRYVCIGLEMHEPHFKTRLKLYAGYRSAAPPNLPFISRAELDLTGAWKTDTYQGVPLDNSRIRVLTRGWPDGMIKKDVLFFAYAQAGRIHFKIGEAGKEPVLALLQLLTHDDSFVLDRCRSLIENDFQFWVLTLREQEMLKNDVRHFTVYYR